MENITTEEVMDKLAMFQARFLKIDKIGWCGMVIIQTDAGTQFTSKEFQKGLSVRGIQLALAPTYHQEMNGQVEVTWKILRTITHSIMVHAQVSDKYIHLALIYTTDHIYLVIPIKPLVIQDGEPTTPQKLATGMKLSV